MKHHKAMRTLGRERNQRKALLRSLARSLVLRKKIKTTVAKAKEVRPFTEKLVTKAKTATLHDRRLISAEIGTEATAKLFKDIAPLYKERKGGYTRITKLGRRLSDGAEMAQIEFV